jgi:dTMP kinase
VRGCLFILEGVDGAGKTVVAERIVQRLKESGYDVIRLFEPTNESEWGQEIRRRSPTGDLSPAEELELFIRDRKWHIANRINPALKEGKIVILDRYFFATGAYQTVSTGVHWSKILQRNREEISAPEPDIIFILDVPAEVGLERVLGDREGLNLQFEQLDRLVKVRAAYLEMSETDTGNYIVVDAQQSLEAVTDEVYAAIFECIEMCTDSEIFEK